jgi:hypothetical protein
MLDGKKSVAESIVYGAFDSVQSKRQAGAARSFSTTRSTTSLRTSKFVRAASVVRPTRFRSMFVLSAARLSRFAG